MNMKRLRETNINTPEYFDNQFNLKEIDSTNLLRQKFYIQEVLSGQKVIELGCGMSYFPQMAYLKGAISYGLDFSEQAISKLRDEFPNVNYIVGDALKTSFEDGFFDVVVSGEVIEHIEEPKRLVEEMNRICKPKGKIILSTPKLEFDDHEHLWEFEEIDLHHLFNPFGIVQTFIKESDKFPGRKYIFMICEKE